jgi:DNA-binding SARP family transcriptional activator
MSVLALHREVGVDRDRLVESVWPESADALGVQSLNTLVYSLRRLLGDAVSGGQPVVHGDGRYRLNTEGGVTIDVAEFDAAADRGYGLIRQGDASTAAHAFEQAVQLYTGDLMIASETWHVLERERLRTRYLSLRARLADLAFADGRYADALANALSLLAADPCREDAHRMAMRCYVRLGQRSQAFRQYSTCRRVLEMEFGALPERATDELHELIRLDPGAV